MANITVSSSGYWGDDSILASGSWSGLAWNDLVTLASGVILTVDASQQTPTGFEIGWRIASTTGFSQLFINNQSTTTPLRAYGALAGTAQFENGSKWRIRGNHIVLGQGTGSASQQLTNYTTIGFDAMDVPAVLFVETGNGTGEYEDWINLGTMSLADIGVGELGRWFSYDDSTGYITFGNGGKPQSLTTNAAADQADIVVSNASDFSADDFIHIIDDNGRETLEILSISGNTITCKTNLVSSYATSASAFIRLTKGGNVVPAGANIRTHNIVVGTKNSGGDIVIESTVSNNFELDVQVGGEIDFQNVNFTGFYLRLYQFALCKIDGAGFLTAIYIRNCNGFNFTNVTFILGEYGTGDIFSPVDSAGGKFTKCNLINNQNWTINYGSDGAIFEECLLANMSLTSSRFLAASFTKNAQLINCKFIGGIYSTARLVVTNCTYTSNPHGTSIATSVYDRYALASSVVGSVVDGFDLMPDGSCNYVSSYPLIVGFEKVGNVSFKSNYTQFWEPINGNACAISNVDGETESTSNFVNFLVASLGVTAQNVKTGYNKLLSVIGSNCIIKAAQTDNREVSTSLGVSTDTHFYEMYHAITDGFMGIFFNPRSDDGTGYTESSVDDFRWNNNGSMYIIGAGGWILYEWPHRILGITSFPSDGSIEINGSGTSNFALQYQIDLGDGNGWSTLATLNHTNLSAHTIDPDIGFRFRVKISHPTGSTSDYLNRLNWSTTVDYATYKYPEDYVDIDITAIDASDLSTLAGARVYIEAAAGGDLTEGAKIVNDVTDSDGNLITSFGYNNDQPITGWVRLASADPYYSQGIISGTITSAGFVANIPLVPDS